MKDGLRSGGSSAAQLERGNGRSSRVIGRRRGNGVIDGDGLESEEKGLDSNDQICAPVISSDLEANAESKQNTTESLPEESVKVEYECEEVGNLRRRGRKRGRKRKSEYGEGRIGDRKKVKESLECKVEVISRVLRSQTMAVQAIEMEENGSGNEVDIEGESNMVGQRDGGNAHYDKKRVKTEEDESDESASSSREKLKGKQKRPVQQGRKRGRPPKKQEDNAVSKSVLDKKGEASGLEKVKRKRGRPPKVQMKNVVLERVVVKKKKGGGSKRKNTRVSIFEGIAKRNDPNSHIGRESRRFSLTEKSESDELGIQELEASSGAMGKGVDSLTFKEEKEGGEEAKHQKGKSSDSKSAQKKLVRDQIIDMLMRAGWTIDYRPRKDRQYNDAVYTSPTGRGYWSVTLAYKVLKSLYEDGYCEPGFTFTPIPDGVLTKLKRKASSGIRRSKSEQEYESGGEMKRRTVKKKSGKNKHAGGKSSNRKRKSSLSGQDILSGKLHKGMLKSGRNRKLQRTQSTKRFALLARNSKEGLNTDTDGYVPYSGKRTLLSWMIDLGTMSLNAKVQYMNGRKKRPLLEGWISRDGIRCGCCGETLTISKFEFHARKKMCEPYQNVILETGISLLQCQLDSWNKQKESERSGFHLVDVGTDDPNDDTCGICGDGGDLICCDGCPSTFHQSCLDIQKFPSGDWHCIYCSCKFCGTFSGDTDQMNCNLDVKSPAILTCHMCEEKYHRTCAHGEENTLDDSSSPSYCGKTCQELFEQLQKLLGVKHELEDGFSWTLVQRAEVGLDISLDGISQKVECNSKLAVALSIMDECFLPIVDQRSGINLIHNVLYNCGSNFNRLNYSGFLTAILEREEEIISAASIRIHGNKLAEMPFIGTRNLYRRQGMCRRLLNGIESALRFLNVEKLVIPAISELMQTWTSVFGFKPLEVSSRKEMRNMNMLVFHGTDMLQKPLLKDPFTEESTIINKVLESNQPDITHGVANNSDRACSIGSDSNTSGKGANLAQAIQDGPAAVESGPQLNEGSLNDSSDITSETTNFPESATGEKSIVHVNLEGRNRNVVCPKPSASDAHAVNGHSVPEQIDEHRAAVDDSIILSPSEKVVKSDSELNGLRTYDMEKKSVGVSCLASEATGREKEVCHQCKEGKETVGCKLKNDDDDVTKQINDSFSVDVNSQCLDVDFVPGSGKSNARPDSGARTQISDDAKDSKRTDSQASNVGEDEAAVVGPKPSASGGVCPTSSLCSGILCQRCGSSNDAVSLQTPPSTKKICDVANDPCEALPVGCDLGSSRKGDGPDSHELESAAGSVDVDSQPSNAVSEANEDCQSKELASGLDKNNDSLPPDRPQDVVEADSVVDHSTSGSGMPLHCGTGGCKAGGAPEVMVVSNQAS